MIWLAIAAYVVVWLLYGRRLTVFLLDAAVRRLLATYPHLYPRGSEARAADEVRAAYVLAGFGLALFWPLVAPALFGYRLMGRQGTFRTPVEREENDRRELEALRRLARENGLPMPGFDPPYGGAR